MDPIRRGSGKRWQPLPSRSAWAGHDSSAPRPCTRPGWYWPWWRMMVTWFACYLVFKQSACWLMLLCGGTPKRSLRRLRLLALSVCLWRLRWRADGGFSGLAGVRVVECDVMVFDSGGAARVLHHSRLGRSSRTLRNKTTIILIRSYPMNLFALRYVSDIYFVWYVCVDRYHMQSC